jgi:hypothetical protein
MAALARLRSRFGSIPGVEERSLLRTFRKFAPTEVHDAIDKLTRTSDRRPSPNAIARAIKAERSRIRASSVAHLAEIPIAELTPTTEIHLRVEALRELLKVGS